MYIYTYIQENIEYLQNIFKLVKSTDQQLRMMPQLDYMSIQPVITLLIKIRISYPVAT